MFEKVFRNIDDIMRQEAGCMTEQQDIRRRQRFQNFQDAFKRLADGVELATERELNPLEAYGLIKAFEFVYETAWKTIKDFYENQRGATMQGPRDAFNHAAATRLIKNGEIWMDMIKSRHQTSHIYDVKVVDEIVQQIIRAYFAEFEQLKTALEQQT